MAKARRDEKFILSRWKYFTKNLYNNSAKSDRFSYEKVVYLKSEELMKVESHSSKINVYLLLALALMFLSATKIQSVWIVVAYMVIVVAGQLVRWLMLPKDISAHLTDSGFRDR